MHKSSLSYIGIATDVERRLSEHNDSGKGSHGSKIKGSWFTSFNGPWKLVMMISGFSKTAHVACEHWLKIMSKESKYNGTGGRVKAFAESMLTPD